MAGFRKSFYVWRAQGDGNELGRAATLPEEALAPGRPRSASRANTPSLDTLDYARKRGGDSLLPFTKGLSRIACHQAFKCAAAAESFRSLEDTRMIDEEEIDYVLQRCCFSLPRCSRLTFVLAACREEDACETD